jgi:hypothetical protein
MEAPMTRSHFWLCCLLVSAVLAGCGQTSNDAQFASHRAKFLLAAEPSGALAISAARKEKTKGHPVTLVGRIGGTEDPWTEGRAAFVITDAVAAPAGHGDDCKDCPFCSKKRDASTLAVVQFVDEQGQILPIDARQLFGIAADQTVVVEGQVEHNDLGMMVVSAKGMFVRR